MSHPQVSVIVPVYNAEKYLCQCIDSVINQSYQKIQLILIDDGSEDRSGQICDDYAVKDSRITVIHTLNQKSLLARKTGVERAIGDYTYFMDADDFLADQDSIKTIVELMKKEQVDIIQFSIDTIDKEGEKSDISAWHTVRPRRIHTSKAILEACFIEGHHSWVLWNKFFKTSLCRQAFSQIENIQKKTGEDAYIYFLIVYFSHSFLSIQTRPLYTYRANSGITAQSQIGIQDFEEYCCEIQLITFLRKFLKTQGKEVSDWMDILETLKRRFFFNVLRRYDCLISEYSIKGYKLLEKYYLDAGMENLIDITRLYQPKKLKKYKFLKNMPFGIGIRYQKKYYRQCLFKAMAAKQGI